MGTITKAKAAPRTDTLPDAPAAASPRIRAGWYAAILAVAALLTYANSVSGPFILDDQSTIVENRQIREWWRLSEVLSPEADTAIAGRPIVNLSLAINYALGGLDVRGYHLANILIHILCGLAAFGVLRRTLELPRVRDSVGTDGTALAFAAALLWVVHPLNSEVVDYLTERTESLMALCYLLTVYASIRAIADQRPPVRRRRRETAHPYTPQAARWRAIAIVACAAGMACKESMVTAPLIVVLFDRIFVFDSFGEALRARRGVYAGLAATWIVLGALMWPGPRASVGGFSTGISPWTYLLNQTTIIAHYLRLAVWPRSLVVFYGWPRPLTVAMVLPHALLVVGLAAATVTALWRAPMVGFLGAWFFVTLAPTSSIVPIATEVGAERRMYLPLLALTTLAVVAACAAWRAIGLRGRSPRAVFAGAIAGGVVLAGVAAALSIATVLRNREYASPVSLARTSLERRPSAVTHHYFGEQLVLAGKHEEGMSHLREAVLAGDSRARYLLGVELFNAGRLNEAKEQLYAFVATSRLPYRLIPHWLEPPPSEVMTARLALARAALMQSDWPRAAEQARLIVAAAPAKAEGHLFLADALFGQQRFGEAAVEYRQYLKTHPDDAHALANLGITAIVDGKLDEAIGLFRRVVALEPRSANAHRLLGMALFDRGDFAAASAEAREGLSLTPNNPALRDLLAQAEGGGKNRR